MFWRSASCACLRPLRRSWRCWGPSMGPTTWKPRRTVPHTLPGCLADSQARHSCLLTKNMQELALLGPLHALSYTEATWGLPCCPGTSNRRLRFPAACLT